MIAARITAALAAAALIAGCSRPPETAQEAANASASATAAATPNPAACPPPEYAYDAQEFGPRPDRLAVPASLAAVAATDNTNLAVTTLAGGQICKDVSWVYGLGPKAQTYLGGRFVAIGYDAYEAFGTMVFDRSGKGLDVDTGNLPSFSPSGRLMAGLELTASGFGGLESFVIWRVDKQGLTTIHRLPEDHTIFTTLAGFTDFEIDRWKGETCLEVFAFGEDDLRAADWDRDKARRTPFHAAEAESWEIRRGRCP